MLDAFLIAGLVTAIATPVLLFAIELLKLAKGVTAKVSWTPGNSKDQNVPLIIEETGQVFVDGPGRVAGADVADANIDGPEIGVIHEIPVDVSQLVIPAFRPGTDGCRVWLRGVDVKFLHHRCEAGVVLVFFDAAERLSITFQGLARPPLADIETVFDCPENGRQVQKLSEPGNADAAEETAEDLDDAEWRLAAWAETERAVEAFDDPVRSGQEKQDISALPEFTEFDPQAEIIEVWVPGALDPALAVEVVPTRDGKHGLVLVDGRATALLQGAPTASARNIRVVPMTAIAA